MIFVPLAGTLRFRVAGDTLVADAQHAVIVRAHTPHSYESIASVEWFIAYVDDSVLGDSRRAFREMVVGEVLEALGIKAAS